MSSVKGSKQYSMKVVPNRPGRTLWLLLLLLVLLALGIGGGYLYGYWAGMGEKPFILGQRDRLDNQLQNSRSDTKKLRQQIANLTLSSKVDRQANDSVRKEVIELREQIASLEADITFYRGLMAPSSEGGGLEVGDMQLTARGQSRRFGYKFVVQQVATQHSVINGELNITLVGSRAEKTERIALHQVSEQLDDKNIKLRFKYFQNIEGELTLPEGFTPEKIELVARSSGKNADKAEKSFDWPARDL